ncbi:MAG: hypothetical protein J6V05_07370, partial [Alistipes sp.]|nr:hypothetical protein [Alistipes sp.]
SVGIMGIYPDSPNSSAPPKKLAGIKNNTRAMVDHSAGCEFITKLYTVAILKLLAEFESGVYLR